MNTKDGHAPLVFCYKLCFLKNRAKLIHMAVGYLESKPTCELYSVDI